MKILWNQVYLHCYKTYCLFYFFKIPIHRHLPKIKPCVYTMPSLTVTLRQIRRVPLTSLWGYQKMEPSRVMRQEDSWAPEWDSHSPSSLWRWIPVPQCQEELRPAGHSEAGREEPAVLLLRMQGGWPLRKALEESSEVKRAVDRGLPESALATSPTRLHTGTLEGAGGSGCPAQPLLSVCAQPS